MLISFFFANKLTPTTTTKTGLLSVFLDVLFYFIKYIMRKLENFVVKEEEENEENENENEEENEEE